jgi:hypothetical protein
MHCEPQVFRQSRSREARAPDHELPEGFIPLRDVKPLPLLGRWPLLDDRMPGWLPFDCLRQMSLRNDAGDPDAREWIDLHRRAVEGDSDAQRAMGAACETGRFGAPVDLQRALFWYWRASLGGDRAGHECALRLKDSIDAMPAAFEDPALIYSGQWRVMREDPRAGISTWIVRLARDGSFSSRAAARSMKGRWIYDNVGAKLTLAIAAGGEQDSESWEIQLLGARDPLLFGRDARRATYVVQRVIQDEAQPGA